MAETVAEGSIAKAEGAVDATSELRRRQGTGGYQPLCPALFCASHRIGEDEGEGQNAEGEECAQIMWGRGHLFSISERFVLWF